MNKKANGFVSIKWSELTRLVLVCRGTVCLSVTPAYLEDDANLVEFGRSLIEINVSGSRSVLDIWQQCRVMAAKPASCKVEWDGMRCEWNDVSEATEATAINPAAPDPKLMERIARAMASAHMAIPYDCNRSTHQLVVEMGENGCPFWELYIPLAEAAINVATHDPKLIEHIARAMCSADGNDPDLRCFRFEIAHLGGIARHVHIIPEEAALVTAWRLYIPLAEAALNKMMTALRETAEMNAAYPLLMEACIREQAGPGESLPQVFEHGACVSHKEDGGVHIEFDPIRMDADALASAQDSILVEAIKRAKEKDAW